MIKKIIFSLFCILIAAIFAGCGEHVVINGKSYRVLSSDEEQQMLLFARLTLVNSGDKISFKIDPVKNKPGVPPPHEANLTQAQKDFIMNTMPSVKLSYKGDKAGKAEYEWIFNDEIMFKVNCEGKFLTESMQVNTRKIKMREIIHKGKKSVVEKLTFKEIK